MRILYIKISRIRHHSLLTAGNKKSTAFGCSQMAKYLHEVSCKSFLYQQRSGLEALWERIIQNAQDFALLRPDSAVAWHVRKTAFAEPADNSNQDSRLWLLEITL